MSVYQLDLLGAQLMCEQTGISAAVNGSPVANFAHRGAYQEIKLVEILGDVQVQMFKEHPVTMVCPRPSSKPSLPLLSRRVSFIICIRLPLFITPLGFSDTARSQTSNYYY